MPIYMDLHIVDGITAKGAAEAHLQDLLIQAQYNCTCMTYWVDESKNSAFCLIDAPNREAVKELHNKAHGLITHQIIEVASTVVESFLGRIYDPESTELLEGKLKVFNDPAFRILLLIQTIDPILLVNNVGKDKCDDLLVRYQQMLADTCREFEGKIADQYENISIISFVTAFKAVAHALKLQDVFSNEEKELLQLKISINAGVPVTKSERLFGDTIQAGERMLLVGKKYQIAAASIIKEIHNKNHFKQQQDSIFTLTITDEKRLNQLINVLEQNSGNKSFAVEALCKSMSMSKSSLNRLTWSLLGKTPNSLINEFRLNKALQLLRKSGDTIAQISFATGFTSPSYFSKCFQNHFQITPTRYLELLKEIKK